MTPDIRKGYAVVTREWKAGDQIELELPMQPQRVVADSRIKADAGLVALQYGPLVYNVEKVDNQKIDRKLGEAPLGVQWQPDLLGGVMTITGKWSDGSELVAVPNYARMDRVGPPHAYPVDEEDGANAGSAGHPDNSAPSIDSKVWI